MTENPLRTTHDTLEKMPKLAPDEKFRFDCHKGLDCWNACCHNTNIFLTPYDILRLKQKAGLGSTQFLEKYTNNFIGEDFGLPVVMLRMTGNGACPFIAAEGCSVYESRPTTCRSYPVGQAVSSGGESLPTGRVAFLLQEEHCKGGNGDKEWNIEKWFENQGVTEYNANNEFIAFLAFHPKLGESELDHKKTGMIFMALYDLDKFRDFIFKSSFLDKFEVDDKTIDAISKDDLELLQFGMRWVEFSILGVPRFKMKEAK